MVFVAFHFIFAVGFALSTPYRKAGVVLSQRHSPAADIGAPDERQHANYVRFLLKQHKLPVLDPKAPDIGEEYESHQPPLYYSLTAVAATITGLSDVETPGFGNVARIFNALIGAFGIVGIFFATLWATKREDLALVGTSFAALLPMNCALSGSISNDPLLIALISWSFAFCARALGSDEGRTVNRSLVLAGVFAGLSCLTKTTGLVSIAGIFFTLVFLRKNIPLPKIAGFLGLGILIAMPIWLRNMSIYGDPLAQSVFKTAFANSPPKSGIVAMIEGSGAPGSPEIQYWLNWVGYWTARSYIGVFGYMDIWLNSSGNPYGGDPNWLYKGIIIFIFIAKLRFLVYLRNSLKEVPKAVWVCLIIALLTVALFVVFNMTYFQAQGRYLLPALAPAAIALSIGWLAVCKQKLPLALVLVTLVFGGTTIYALTQLSSEFALRVTTGM